MKYLLLLLLLCHQLDAQDFIEDIGNSFINISGDVKFSDMDGDGELDIIISGWSDRSEGERETILYINQGNRIFLESMDNDLESLGHTSLSVGDIDSDGDNDLLLTGNQGVFVSFTYLYENNGGILSIVPDSDIEHVNIGTSNFIDIDNDGDLDIFLTGINRSFQKVSQLYINDSNGQFVQDTISVFEGVDESAIDFADIENDGDIDFILSGWDNSFQPITKLYVNNGVSGFEEKTSNDIVQIRKGDIKFNDLDNDGDQDFIILGSGIGTNRHNTKLYANDGNGNFTEDESIEFSQLSTGSIAYIDVDNDNDNDVVLSGSGLNGSTSVLYQNIGNLDFTQSQTQPFENLNGKMETGDIDNDTDYDIMFSGGNTTEGELTKLYFNSNISDNRNLMSDDITFALSPNPTIGNKLQITHKLKNINRVSIYNLEGKAINNYRLTTGLESSLIEFEYLIPGLYIVQIESKERNISLKFLKI